jgi:hypothetical protein
LRRNYLKVAATLIHM